PKTIWMFYRDGVKERWEPTKKKETGPPPSPSPGPQPVKPSQPTAGVVAPLPTIESIAESLYLDPAWLSEVRDVLHDRGQIVLHGPPGTGKTRIARDLAS